MALLNSFLQHKPDKWDECNYNNRRYVRIALNPRSSEYKRIKSKFIQTFGYRDICEIERIQHPFAYFGFQMRKDHLTKIYGRIPQESRKFFRVGNARKINKILEYNCDQRMGNHPYIFDSTSLSPYGGYILAVKTFFEYDFDERDTHRYPEYLIKYDQAEKDDWLDGMDRLTIY